MNSRTDQQLLAEYAERADEGAFSELVRRYVDLVYTAALRMVRDTHLAEDVSQKVFVALARNAGRIADGAVLSNWLHRTAHNISANTIRAEVRRRVREKEAVTMNDLLSPGPDPCWETIAPSFDDVFCELSEPDREAILLRYFQHKSAREMAAALGVSSEAAQKRVNRAIDRLRDLFGKRGIAVGTSGLALLVTANAVHAAPPELAVAISGAALAETSCHATTVITTTKLIAMTTLQKTLIATTILVAIGVGLHHARHQAHVATLAQASRALPPLARPNEAPKPQLDTAAKGNATRAQRTRQSRLAGSPNSSAAQPFTSTHIYQLLKTKAPTLTLAQVEPYLKTKEHSAAALLAGFRTTSDPSLLAEAVAKYPTNAQVAFEAAIRNGLSAEERLQWLDALKQAAPDNALANYLAADAHFKTGQVGEAIQDLTAASAQQLFQHYSTERVNADEEVYLSAGYAPGEAKLLANAFLTTPYLLQFKELGQELVDLAGAYQAAGDQSSREAALQTAINLGRRLTEPAANEALSSQLIGINIERAALAAMDPAATSGADGQTVQQRLDQLAQQKEGIHVLTRQADPLWGTLSDQDWTDYHAQLAAAGEANALQWLVSNYGRQ